MYLYGNSSGQREKRHGHHTNKLGDSEEEEDSTESERDLSDQNLEGPLDGLVPMEMEESDSDY